MGKSKDCYSERLLHYFLRSHALIQSVIQGRTVLGRDLIWGRLLVLAVLQVGGFMSSGGWSLCLVRTVCYIAGTKRKCLLEAFGAMTGETWALDQVVEVVFSIRALTKLCFALVARKVWLTPQSFGCHWAVLHCIKSASPTFLLPRKLELGMTLGKDTARTADPGQRVFHKIRHLLIYKNCERRGKEGGGREGLGIFSSMATALCTEALLPRKKLDIISWWDVENKSFGSLCFHAQSLLLLY